MSTRRCVNVGMCSEEQSSYGIENVEKFLVEVLDGLEGRLKLLDTVLEHRCDTMKDKLQELTVFQVCVACIFVFFVNKSFFFSLALSLTNAFSSVYSLG